MKLIKVMILASNGQKMEALINPERICSVMTIQVPSDISGPSGEKVAKSVVGVDFGSGLVPIDCPMKDFLEMIGADIETLKKTINEDIEPRDQNLIKFPSPNTGQK